MAFNLASITSETRLRAPRLIVLGVPKIGKSSFAAGSDRPVFIPIRREEGIDGIPAAKFPVCNTYQDVLSCLDALCSEQHIFGTSVLDSSSALEPLVWDAACARNGHVDSIEKVMGGYGKGYSEALKEWGQITDALDYLRNEKSMASIIIGHVKVKRFDSPEGESYDQWQWDINEKAASLLYKWADAIIFCNTKVVVRKEDVGFKKEHKTGLDISGGQRFIYTQKNPAYPAGGRDVFGQLPAELPLNFGSYMDAVSAVSQKRQQQQQ